MNSEDNSRIERALTPGGQAKPILHRAKMAVPPDAQPGLELDNKGNQIPFDERTEEDRERARKSRRTE